VSELTKALGIITTKGLAPDGKGRVSWLSDRDVARLSEAAFRVDRGEVRIRDLAQGLATRPTKVTGQLAVCLQRRNWW